MIVDDLKINLHLNDRYTKAMRGVQQFQKNFTRKFNQNSRLMQSGMTSMLAGGAGLYGLISPVMAFETQLGKVAVAGNLGSSALANMRKDVVALNGSTGDGLANITQMFVDAKRFTGLAGAALKEVTKTGLFLKKIYNFTPEKVLAGQVELMRNFGITAEHAGDAMGYLASQGGDARDELIDGIGEYSVQLNAAGLSLEQSVSVMTQGLGTWNVDKAMDVIKEGAIRLKQMNTPVVDALSMLGLQDMIPDLQRGVMPIDQAMLAIGKKLESFEEPEQLKLNAAIFGTPAEDIGSKHMISLLRSIGRDTKVKGAMKHLHNLWNATPAALFATMRGQVQNLGNAFGSALLPVLIPIVEKMTEWSHILKAHIEALPNLTKLVVVGAGAFFLLAAALGAVSVLIGVVKTGMLLLKGALVLTGGLWGIAIMAVVGAVYLLIKHWDTVIEKLKQAYEWIKKLGQAAWSSPSGPTHYQEKLAGLNLPRDGQIVTHQQQQQQVGGRTGTNIFNYNIERVDRDSLLTLQEEFGI